MHALGREEIEGMKKWKELTLRIRVRRCYESGRKCKKIRESEVKKKEFGHRKLALVRES